MIKTKRFSYIGDFSSVDLTSPNKIKVFLNVINTNFDKKNRLITSLRNKIKSLLDKFELLDNKIYNSLNDTTINTEISENENLSTINDEQSITSDLCLICLQTKGTISIISEELSGVSLLDKIKCITDVLIPDDYFLAKSVCAECAIKINSCYKFKIQCQQSIIKFTTLADQIIKNSDDNFSNKTELNYDNTNNNNEPELKTDYELSEENDLNALACQEIKPKSDIDVVSTKDFETQFTSIFLPVIKLENIDIDTENNIDESNDDSSFTHIEKNNSLISDETKEENILDFSPEIPLELSDKYTDESNYESENDIPEIDDQKQNLINKILPEMNSKQQCTSQNPLRSQIKHKISNYECVECNKTFPSILSLKKHIISHNSKFDHNQLIENDYEQFIENNHKHFTCNICGRKRLSKNSLRLHILKHRISKYKCDECEKTFLTKGSLDEHKILHTNEKPYECEICSKKYKQRKQLWAHKNRCNTKDKVICEICSKILTNERSLNIHLLTHGPPQHKCDLCDKVFHTPTSKKKHEKLHTGIRHSCDECENTFSTPIALKAHKNLVHLGIVKYQCISCGKQYLNLYNYKQHLLSHTGEKPYACEYCNKNFSAKQQLNSHLSKHHNIHRSSTITSDRPAKMSQCKICNEKFSSALLLRNHSKNHPELLQCKICNKQLSSSLSLTLHMKIHTGYTGKRFKCNQCTKAFTSKPVLNFHLMTHTGENPFKCKFCTQTFTRPTLRLNHEKEHSEYKPIKCDFCPKEFVSTGHLKLHTRMHTGEKPYKCSYCDKMFSASGNRDAHIRTHTGEKPHACKECDAKFHRLKTLNNHIQQEHT